MQFPKILGIAILALSLFSIPAVQAFGATVTPVTYDALADTASGTYDPQFTPSGDLVQCSLDAGSGYFSKTTDGGTTYNPARKSVSGGTGQNCALFVESENVYYWATAKQIYKTTNGGIFWDTYGTAPAGGFTTTINGVDFDMLDGGTKIAFIAAGTGGTAGTYYWYSSDSGATWTTALLVSASSQGEGQVSFGASSSQVAVLIGNSANLYRSTDTGATFTLTTIGQGFSGGTSLDYANGNYATIGDTNGVLSGARDVTVAYTDSSVTTGGLTYEILSQSSPATVDISWTDARFSSTGDLVYAYAELGTGSCLCVKANQYTPGGSPAGAITVRTPNVTHFDIVGFDENLAVLQYGGIDYFLLDSSTGAQSSWCSNPFAADFEGDTSADFGYNYVEGVTYETDPSPDSGTGVTVSTADGYRFESTSDNYDYMGKGWTTETHHVKSIFRIEALTEGRSTDFRSIFSLETDTPSSTSKGTGSTAGDTSGSFATHIGVRFRESGDDWLVQVEFNNDALDDGNPVDLGSAAITGDPNNPTTYSLEINTTAPGYVAVKNEAGADIRNFTIQGNANTQFAALVGSPLWSQWFVSGGSNSLLNSVTYLDDNLDSGDTDDSTCIFFLDVPEVAVTGDPGTAPGSLIPPDPTPTPTVAPGFDDLAEDFGNVFGGIGAEGGAVFLGIFWILVFAAGAYGILGGSPLAIGIGALCGFVFSIFTGLIPDILVFVVVLLAGAAVGMRLFAGGGSGADG